MSHTWGSRDERRSLRAEPERRPEPLPSQELTPELVAHLQRGAGNAAVGRLLRETSDEEGAQPMRTAAEFKKDSKLKSGLITLPRSDELKEIDASLAAYDAVRGGDLATCLAAILDLETKISTWMQSKGPRGAWRATQRADEVEALDDERKAERLRIEAAINSAERAAATATKNAKMDPLLTHAIKATTGNDAKARAVFNAYMREFRGKAIYNTTSKGSIWDNPSGVACATIAAGLKDLLIHAGLGAKVVRIGPSNFVTNRLGTDFIDSTAAGNLRRPGKEVADERRFFFSEHHVVEVEDGLVYFDPTSGIEVTADAPEIVWFKDLTKAGGGYADATWSVQPVAKDDRGGSIYELTSVASYA